MGSSDMHRLSDIVTWNTGMYIVLDIVKNVETASVYSSLFANPVEK